MDNDTLKQVVDAMRAEFLAKYPSASPDAKSVMDEILATLTTDKNPGDVMLQVTLTTLNSMPRRVLILAIMDLALANVGAFCRRLEASPDPEDVSLAATAKESGATGALVADAVIQALKRASQAGKDQVKV